MKDTRGSPHDLFTAGGKMKIPGAQKGEAERDLHNHCEWYQISLDAIPYIGRYSVPLRLGSTMKNGQFGSET